MKTEFPDDNALHASAKLHAAQHRVNYAEALSAVVEIARREALAAASSERSPKRLSDAALDAAAKAYSRSHGVSYSEALTHAVMDLEIGSQAPSYSEQRAEPRSDAAVDIAAQAYARGHNVSYSEGLDHVCESGSGAVEFKEAAQTLTEPIEIFHAGTRPADNGKVYTITAADLAAAAAAYNPALHEAPLTLGHPLNDRPAYGWVNGLEATTDGTLLMRAGQVDPAFAESVKAGRYKKRSASFYAPGDPVNPTPGTWYLRHVAWLGAQPPAVKGLTDVAFGASDAAVTFQF
jgi:hypothetical protein